MHPNNATTPQRRKAAQVEEMDDFSALRPAAELKNTDSPVWMIFMRTSKEGEKKKQITATCRICKKVYMYI